MKLLRVGQKGVERPAMLDAVGGIRDISSLVTDISGQVLGRSGMDRLARINPASLPLVAAGTRIGPCVGSVGKIVCVGLNYFDGAAEVGALPPDEPILFLKATSAINGPYDRVVMPRGSEKMDWEVELAVVIGEEARDVPPEQAMAHIAGYCIMNDLGDRAFQIERGGQWTKGKSADTFAPIGPWLVSSDEISDPQDLDLWLSVDGETRQAGSSRSMIFPVRSLVSYISRFMTLQPGDIVSTGTPAGVAMGMKPRPRYLRPGQTMRAGITGLGEQGQSVEAIA